MYFINHNHKNEHQNLLILSNCKNIGYIEIVVLYKRNNVKLCMYQLGLLKRYLGLKKSFKVK